MELPKRKNPRLMGYDYSREGGYFVTVCIQQHKCVLSCIQEGSESERAAVKLTVLGRIAEETLEKLAAQYGIVVDCRVIMPNHIDYL